MLGSDGALHPGSLVENLSLGLAMCAERVAMFSAVTVGAGQIAGLALVFERTDGQITMPCGACCQVGLELVGPGLQVAAADPDGALAVTTIAELLPRGPHKSA